MKNISLSKIVWVVAGIGMALAAFFAQIEARQMLRTSAAMEQSEKLVSFSVALSAMVHEQQKERGASAVFLTSNGKNFSTEMRQQRSATNEKRKAVADLAAQLAHYEMRPAIADHIKTLPARNAEVDNMRGKIDGLTVSRAEQVAFYTKINREEIGIVGEIASEVANPELAKSLLIYSALLYGTDDAGIERAIGASGFAAGAFSVELKQKLLTLSGSQNSLFSYVKSQASPEERAELENLQTSPTAKQIDRMRTIALSADAEEIGRVSASQWFDAVTKKIGDLIELENGMAANIVELIDAEVARTNAELAKLVALLVGGFIIAAALCTFCVRNIRTSAQNVVEPLRELASGNLDVVIPPSSKNEFGIIADAMRVFHKNESERQQQAKIREKTVDTLGSSLKKMAAGDLQNAITEPFDKEYEQIRQDFNQAQEALRQVVRSVVTSADEMKVSANEVNQAADDLSMRTTRQAATLEETAAALEKTTTSIHSSAKKAQEINEGVGKTRETAAENGKIVQSAVSSMEQIETSFAQVEQISKMIQDIAFQTNLLALNAGVEATRAGDAGRGFAVVANEVRALAQRSSESVTDIQELIARSAKNIQQGALDVNKSGEALEEMVKMIDKVSESVAEIAESSQHQAMGLNEINSSVAQLDQATQQNAAMAEESTAASRQLNGEAEHLVRMTAVFNLGEASHSVAKPDLKLAS